MFKPILFATVLVATGLLVGCGADGSVTSASSSSSTTVTVPATPAPVTTPVTPTPVVAPKPIVKIQSIDVPPDSSNDNYNVADGGYTYAYQQKLRVDVPKGTYLGKMWVCLSDQGNSAAPVTVTSSAYDGAFITNGGGGIGTDLVNGKGKVSIDTSGFFTDPVVPEFFVWIDARVARGAPRTTVRLVIDQTSTECGPTGVKLFGTDVDQDVTGVKPSNTATFVPTSTSPGGPG